MRRGILVPGGACARTERQAGRSGKRVEVQRAALAPRTRALVAYTARGTNFFPKMTVFFSTHSIENFASIYGS